MWVHRSIHQKLNKTQHEETEMDHAFSHRLQIRNRKWHQECRRVRGQARQQFIEYKSMHLHSCKTQQSSEQPGYFSLLKIFILSFMQNFEIMKGGGGLSLTQDNKQLSCVTWDMHQSWFPINPRQIKPQIQPSSPLKDPRWRPWLHKYT